MDSVALGWWLGSRVPTPVGDALARVAAPLALRRDLPAVQAWADTVEQATGVAPTRRQRRLLLENWIRNNLWSLRLSRWSDPQVLQRVVMGPGGGARLRASLDGPGLVVALPHMGSWDAAGMWAAANGMKVVSVAERLPRGAYERFRDARAAAGMTIYPVDERGVMGKLVGEVRDRAVVCLLSDRDLSSRGVRVWWPGAAMVGVPTGPAVLARRTGADLRVVTTHFDGPVLRLEVSDVITGDDVAQQMARVVEHFAAAVARHPESWLMLRHVFVDQQCR